MPITPIFAQRSIDDQKKIERAALRSAVRVAGKVRARMIEAFNRGEKFAVQRYVVAQLLDILTNTMLAAHLSGFRRFFLMRRQEPSLKRKLDDGILTHPALRLSALDDALQILSQRTGLDLTKLQEQYNTRALRVLNDVSRDVELELEKTFADLISEGVTTRNAIKALGEKFDELGLSPAKPFQLETIFRTQTQLTFAAGKYQAEQDPDIQEILWGYKYVTVGDDRVRESHAAIDGVTLPKDDPFWNRFTPPNGWNCRCQIIPIFETREIQRPPATLDDGEPLLPDKGFDFNPGKILAGA